MAALAVGIHEDRRCRVLQHLGSRLSASLGQSLLGIVDNQFLAEGIDEGLGATGDDELVGVALGEAYHVADDVAPQTAGRRDDHRIVALRLDAPEGNGGRLRTVELVHRDEFEEDAVVYHQTHGSIGRVVLQAKEAFGGVVRLHVVHRRRSDKALVLLAVGREGHTAVEEDLQVGPYVFEVLLAAKLHHAVQDGEHPRGHAAQVRHVLPNGFASDAVALDFEVAEQGCGFLRHTYHVDQRIDVLDEDGTEVAHQTARQVIVGGMTAAQDECLAIEDATLGVVAQVPDHSILATGIMCVVQAVDRDGDELALVVRRAARLGIPLHAARPQHIALALSHTVDVSLQLLVGVEGCLARKVLVAETAAVAVCPTPFGVGCFLRQTFEDSALQGLCLCGVEVELPAARREDGTYETG